MFSATGQRFEVADAWPGATQIVAMAVSRDGARIAALLVAGGRPEVWIAGIVRGDDNRARADRRRRAARRCSSGPASGLAWLDDTTVGVLTGGGRGPAVHRAARRRPGHRHGRAGRVPRPSPAPPRSRPSGCAPRTARCTSSAARTGSARPAASWSWPRSRARRSSPGSDSSPAVSRRRACTEAARPRPATARADASCVGWTADGWITATLRAALADALALVLPVACAGCDEPDVALCEDCAAQLRPAGDAEAAPGPPSGAVCRSRAFPLGSCAHSRRTGGPASPATSRRRCDPPSQRRRRRHPPRRTGVALTSCRSRRRARRTGVAAIGSWNWSRGGRVCAAHAADGRADDRRPARSGSVGAAPQRRAARSPRGAPRAAGHRDRRRRDHRRHARRGGSRAARRRSRGHRRGHDRGDSAPRRAAT